MPTDELLEQCLALQAMGGDVEPLLAAHPAQRAEVAALLRLAEVAHTLPPAPPLAADRLWSRIRPRLNSPSPSSLPDEDRLRVLAARLGVTAGELRRYLGPLGAAQVGEFLGLPGYGALFLTLGLVLRCIRTLGGRGVGL